MNIKTPITLAKYPQQPNTNSNNSYNMIPPPDYQMLTVGMRGSGKTTFNRILLSKVVGKRPIAILDSKPDDSLLIGNHLLIERADDIDRWNPTRNPVLVYRPEARELIKPEIMDNWLQH